MSPHPHIVKSFEEELKRLGEVLDRMGQLAVRQLREALDALAGGDDALAHDVESRDARLDDLDRQAGEAALRLLALRQPMAGDLREVVTAIKLASDLERIGDLTKNLARRVHVLRDFPQRQSFPRVDQMGRAVQEQLGSVLRAYAERDSARALAVWQRDREVDDWYHGVFRELLTYMMEDPRTISHGTHLLFIAKNLERIGDHCTHIAATVHYLVEGTPLTEARPKGEDTAYTVVEPPPR